MGPLGSSSTRRAVLIGGLGLAALVGVGGGVPAAQADRPPWPGGPGDPDPFAPVPAPVGMTTPAPAAPCEPTTVMHVIAHPDDDLFFMNPEIEQAITAGHHVVGVCVTAAESAGRNGPGRHVSDDDYVKARQNGLRGAYGQMATGDPAAPWTRGTMLMPGGARAEVDTLGDRVTLVFLNIRKTFLWGRLRNLWSGEIVRLPTLVPTHSALHRHFSYDHDGLVQALVHLLDVYRPTLVRTMDPDPDLQVHDHRYPRHTDFGDLSDHEDHIATAHFTWAALMRWKGPGRHWTAEAYRGYYNCRWPFNLSIPAWQAKHAVLRLYDGAVPDGCDDPAGCADLSMRGRITGTGWGQSTHHRYMTTSPWLLSGPGGVLTAFAVLDGQAAMWHGPGSEPALFGGGPLAPALAAALGNDGRWRVAGLRLDRMGPDDDARRSVVLARQKQPHGDFGPWESLGSPDHRGDRRHTGVPFLAVAGDTVHVFARTAARGLAVHDGKAWRDLGGGPVQEGACAVTTADGRIEIFAAGQSSLLHWWQSVPGGGYAVGSTGLPAPATPPQAVECADGTMVVVYRQPRTAEVVAFVRPPGARAFGPEPVSLGGQGGFGTMRALLLPAGPTRPETLVLVQRNDAGTVSVALAPTARLAAAPTSWRSLGSWFVHSPGAAVGPDGRVVVGRLTPAAGLDLTTLD